MDSSIAWMEYAWLLTSTAEGVITVVDHKNLDTEFLHIFEGANGQVYLILDIRKAAKQIDPAVFRSVMESPAVRHQNCAALILVGSSSLTQFIASNMVQRAKTEIVVNAFSDPVEAEAYLRDLAAVNPNLATENTYRPPDKV